MAHRKLLAENLAALGRGMLLMALGILLFAVSQDAVNIEHRDIAFAIIAAIFLYAFAFLVLPSET
jgi:hypothetical protein